jgi:hypothetical protein
MEMGANGHSFDAAVINAANDYIYDAVEDLQNSLLSSKEFNEEEVRTVSWAKVERCFWLRHFSG